MATSPLPFGYGEEIELLTALGEKRLYRWPLDE
jgi:hypothetical protein